MTWPTLLSALLLGQSLSADDTSWAMAEVMAGHATPAQLAGFAVGLRAKGETAQELTGLVRVMLDRCAPIDVPLRAVDTCGTGGDLAHTVNISTMAALVVAGAGAPVVKHGNRAASSQCGSADLLEELGVVIDLPAEGVLHCIAEAGIGFCFAPVFHPAMRHVATARRELGVSTVFNFLGPLANPARPAAQAVGVSELRMAPIMAGVLAERGISALVFRGEDGLDELTTTAASRVWAVHNGTVSESRVDAVDLGISRAMIDELHGADATFNAKAARSMLSGEHGPVRDAVVLNAAAALAAYDGIEGDNVQDQLAAAVPRAAASIDSGAASDVLDRWVDASKGFVKS
ncbi:MAG: anthranilate phosphoribosyltransferase [Mycobacteriales bacterium]